MHDWSLHRILFYTGLAIVLGFWIVAVIGLLWDVTLSAAYNLSCTAAPPPLTIPASCSRLAAQAGEAVAVALLGGLAGFVGLALTYVGAKGSKTEGARLARKLRF